MERRIRLHAVVLAWPFAKAIGLASAGLALALLGWPAAPAGFLLLGAGAAIATLAVWRWQRPLVVVTPETLAVVIERPLLGRLLGYGTLVAGETEIPFVRLGD
jgi:hypothetical protein